MGKEYLFGATYVKTRSEIGVTYVKTRFEIGATRVKTRSEIGAKMFVIPLITEDKGLLNVDYIKKQLNILFSDQYKEVVEFCYLFGSYAKGYAREKSDVDLCVSTSLKGLDFVGLSEDIRTLLHKKIDLIRFDTLKDNLELIKEIMKDGIKIY